MHDTIFDTIYMYIGIWNYGTVEVWNLTQLNLKVLKPHAIARTHACIVASILLPLYATILKKGTQKYNVCTLKLSIFYYTSMGSRVYI